MNIDSMKSIGIKQPLVQQLLQIAEENLIRKNKVLSTDRLYQQAKSRLKRPRNELIATIQWIFEQKIMVEGSKLTKALLLKNQNRRVIYEYIKEHLAVNFSSIRSDLSSRITNKIESPGQIVWHLQMLLKYGYIQRLKFKNYSLFSPAELNSDLIILIFLLKDEINKKIVVLLSNIPTLKRSDVHKHIDEGREVVYYRINNLLNNGILSKIEGTSTKLQLNPLRQDMIFKILDANRKQNIQTIEVPGGTN